MLVSDYIQWNLDNQEMDEVSAPFLAYAKTKKTMMNQYRFERYSQIIRNKFNNSENMEDYLNLVRSIIGNQSFQGALDSAVNEIAFPSKTNAQLRFVRGIQDDLKTNVKHYQALISEIQNAVGGIVSAFNAMNLEHVVSPEANKALNEIFKDSSNPIKFVKYKDHVKLENTAIGQYKHLMSLMPAFQNIVAAAKAGKGGTDASIEILSKILVPIQTLIGFSSEFQINHEVEKIIKDLADFTHSPNMSIKRVGGEGSTAGGYKIGTADLTLNLGEGAGLSFNLPNLGMSLKRSAKNINTAESVNIKLKGSSYGKLLHDVDPQLQTAFYTIYAYTNPKGLGDVSEDALNGAYKLMKMEASISALIGNIDSDDLVFVLVVNNKSVTIFDLLKSMATSNNDPFTLTPAFKNARGGLIAQHKAFYQKNASKATERSDKLRSYISNKMSASVTMKLTRSQLSSFV